MARTKKTLCKTCSDALYRRDAANRAGKRPQPTGGIKVRPLHPRARAMRPGVYRPWGGVGGGAGGGDGLICTLATRTRRTHA